MKAQARQNVQSIARQEMLVQMTSAAHGGGSNRMAKGIGKLSVESSGIRLNTMNRTGGWD